MNLPQVLLILKITKALVFIAITYLGLLIGHTISIYFNGWILADSFLFVLWVGYSYKISFLPGSFLVWLFILFKKHVYFSNKNLFIITILSQLITIELLLNIPNLDSSQLFFILSYLCVLIVPIFFLYLVKNISAKFAISFIGSLIVIFYIYTYFTHQSTAADICKDISTGTSEKELLYEVEKHVPLTETRDNKNEYFIPDKDGYLLHKGVSCSITLDENNNVILTKKFETE